MDVFDVSCNRVLLFTEGTGRYSWILVVGVVVVVVVAAGGGGAEVGYRNFGNCTLEVIRKVGCVLVLGAPWSSCSKARASLKVRCKWRVNNDSGTVVYIRLWTVRTCWRMGWRQCIALFWRRRAQCWNIHAASEKGKERKKEKDQAGPTYSLYSKSNDGRHHCFTLDTSYHYLDYLLYHSLVAPFIPIPLFPFVFCCVIIIIISILTHTRQNLYHPPHLYYPQRDQHPKSGIIILGYHRCIGNQISIWAVVIVIRLRSISLGFSMMISRSQLSICGNRRSIACKPGRSAYAVSIPLDSQRIFSSPGISISLESIHIFTISYTLMIKRIVYYVIPTSLIHRMLPQLAQR